MSEHTTATDSCPGIVNLRPVFDLELLHQPSGPLGERLVAAGERARADAGRILEQVLADPLRHLPEPGRLAELLAVALAVADSGTTAEDDTGSSLPTRREVTPFGGEARTNPLPSAHRWARSGGGISAAAVERLDRRIAHVTACFGRSEATTATARLVLGRHVTVPADGAARILVTIDGPATLHTPDGVSDVHPGGSLRFENTVAAISTDHPALLLEAFRPTVEYGVTAAIRKAGHLPRLRANMAIDPTSPVRIYGSDDEATLTDLFNEQAVEAMGGDTGESVTRWWMANALPVIGPEAIHLLLPVDPATWPAVEVRGRFPAGVLMSTEYEDGLGLVAAAYHFDVPQHLLPFIEALLLAEPVLLSSPQECPAGDPMCRHRATLTLAGAGLVTLTVADPAVGQDEAAAR